jgi:hypothetical protein
MLMEWKADFLKIWQRMVSRKDSEFFRDPVDWESLELYDYPTIIKKPMDLRTIKSNLEHGRYLKSTEAAADVRLIFSNAMTYNAPGSRVYTNAKSLGEFWESNWASIAGAEDDIDRPPSKEALLAFVEKSHLYVISLLLFVQSVELQTAVV